MAKRTKRIIAFLFHQLCANARATHQADHPRPLAKLDVVKSLFRSEYSSTAMHCPAEYRFRSQLQTLSPNLQNPQGRDNIALLAIQIMQHAIRAERFGSYSIAGHLAGTPSLLRLKSINR